MSVQVLQIERKIRRNPVRPVSLDDFEWSPAGTTVAPSILLDEPTITPYSLDHAQRRAIFVETPPDVDLSQAPFYYQWQYEHAVRLFVAPYDLLYDLTQTIRLQGENLIIIHSTGRCGSTLFSHAFNQVPGVVSLSEPDVYTLLVGLRRPDGSLDPELGNSSALLLFYSASPRPQKGHRRAGRSNSAAWSSKSATCCMISSLAPKPSSSIATPRVGHARPPAPFVSWIQTWRQLSPPMISCLSS